MFATPMQHFVINTIKRTGQYNLMISELTVREYKEFKELLEEGLIEEVDLLVYIFTERGKNECY